MKLHLVTWRSFAAASYVTHELCVASSARSFSIVPWNFFPTVNFLPTVNSVTHALQLRPMWCTHYVWRAPLAIFLLYHELFSDCELFTDHELHDAHTLAPPHMTHALCVVSSACSFYIVLWTLFRPWTLYRPWTPWCTHFGSASYDTRTTCC